MIYCLTALCIIIFAGGYYFSRENVFSPATITSAIWLVCLSMFLLLEHDLPPLSGKFCGALALWIVSMFAGTMCSQSMKYDSSELKANENMRDIFLLVSSICFPFLFVWAYNVLEAGESGNWAADLRNAALGKSQLSDKPYGGMQILIWQITYLAELVYFEKRRWWRTALPALFILCFGFFTMSKITFLTLFIISACILFFQKKISIAKIAAGFCVLLITVMALQNLRNRNLNGEGGRNDFMVLYMLSSMTAFDTSVEPCSATHPGENTFRIYYAIRYKAGLSDIEPINPLLKFIEKPISTNTYTGMYPFYKDYGMAGVGIFGFVLGIIYGYFFRRAQYNNTLSLIIYAYLSGCILMQYVADIFFTNFSGTVKFMILASLLFIPERINIRLSK